MLIRFAHQFNTSMFLSIFFVLIGSLGCGSNNTGYNDSVSGTVMLNGEIVAGEVVFVGADKKENVSLINSDGKYNIINPTKGQVQILVRKGLGSPIPGKASKSSKGMPELPGTTKNSGVAPPIKYAKPTGELTFTVESGKQSYDIELK